MKIAVVGASGQLGKEWQEQLRENYSEDIEMFAYTSSDLDITHYQEVSDEMRKRRPDVVINCAAYTDVDGAEKNRKLAHKINVEAVLYLAELSKELEFKLVHYSTDYVFPGHIKDRKALPEGYPETYKTDPINWYGRTKWEGEQAVRSTANDYLIVRVSWLCGQHGNNFVKTMLRLGRERDKVQVVDDQWGSPTFTGNVVQNTLVLLRSDHIGTFHVTSKGLISWHDFAKEIFNQSNIVVEVEAVSSEAFPTVAKRPHFSKLSTEEMEHVEGNHIISWKEGLRNLLTKLENSGE